MAQELIKQHDELAKKFLTDVTAAREFLQIHLDPKIIAKCDLNTLHIESGSYVDNDLRKRFSDVVYKMDLLNKSNCVYIHILIEHQSTAEKLMPIRIVRYQLAILQKHIDDYGVEGNLPLVFPLVLYNGKDSPYPYATDIHELFADKELVRYMPIGSFKLIDLTVMPDDKILQHGKIALLEMLQKHIAMRDFSKVANLILSAVLVAHDDNISKSLFDSALSYLIYGRERTELEPLLNMIVDNISEYKEDVMTYAEELRQEGEQRAREKFVTYAEELRQEGEKRAREKFVTYAEELRQEGEQRAREKFVTYAEELRQEGIQKTQIEMIRKMLKAGASPSFIKQVTNLDEEKIREIEQSMH